jgi:hypothetical protein
MENFSTYMRLFQLNLMLLTPGAGGAWVGARIFLILGGAFVLEKRESYMQLAKQRRRAGCIPLIITGALYVWCETPPAAF